jgi:hypothetical protein
MTGRYALVEDGLVVNIIEWDGQADWSPPDNFQAIAAEPQVGIGWRREDGAWLEPEAI